MNINAMKEKWAKARPGPWEVFSAESPGPYQEWNDDPIVCMKRNERGYGEEDSTVLDLPTAQAIADAPTDIATLIAEFERLKRAMDEALARPSWLGMQHALRDGMRE